MAYRDKEKQAAYARKHYLLNKEKLKKRAVACNIVARKRNKDFTSRVKRRFGCHSCGIKNSLCLDFHHLRDKTVNVADAVKKSWSLESIKNEIRKCQILCANCHRIETLS